MKICINPGHGDVNKYVQAIYAPSNNNVWVISSGTGINNQSMTIQDFNNTPSPKYVADCGATGFNNYEYDIVLKIGKLAAMYLAQAGYEVELYQFDGLNTIANEANSWDSDIFVSIHCNAANTQARGTETYSYYGSYEGKRLSQSIYNQIIVKMPMLVQRGTKEAGFAVIKNTNCPACLVETAFIDNAQDSLFLTKNLDNFARAIAVGITDYVASK